MVMVANICPSFLSLSYKSWLSLSLPEHGVATREPGQAGVAPGASPRVLTPNISATTSHPFRVK